MPDEYDAIIIGSGLIGTAIAFELAKKGYRTLNVDRCLDLRPQVGNYDVPIGSGIGQVIKAAGIVYNIFFEPQFTILHDGAGQPKVQLFVGLTLQFPT